MTTPRAPGQPLLSRVVITDEDHRVLLVHTAGSHPQWGLPGGLVELSARVLASSVCCRAAGGLSAV
ncbi:NUDIX domain-containing protein [Streptomyces sp. SDr-06]|uniref:NUDIX domain-containing protein n=1 Tax=Streptomyces sp. SDr-06 TaxID=2267702 RepID=UPI000DE984F9|nr:NUDIX domain-containing protein [Streptomyces sp. SDr-06]RCH67487.1 hypothetical protein DT019_17940 [Streptomyces sp. SDr-06]